MWRFWLASCFRSSSAQEDRKIPNYRPFCLKLPALVFLAVYIGLLLTALEWGCRGFPTSSGVQTIPNDEQTGGRVVFHSAPLVQARATRTTPTATPSVVQRTRIPPRTIANAQSTRGIPSPSPKKSRDAGSLYLNHNNRTTAFNGTANLNGTELPPPAVFAGIKAYPPSYLEYLTQANGSQSWNNSLRARHPGESNYGQLDGRRVFVMFGFVSENELEDFGLYPGGGDDYGGSFIQFFYDVAAVSRCDPQRLYGSTAGIALCSGPAFVFVDDNCFKVWQHYEDLEKTYKQQKGSMWQHYEMLGWKRWQPGIFSAMGEIPRCSSEKVGIDMYMEVDVSHHSTWVNDEGTERYIVLINRMTGEIKTTVTIAETPITTPPATQRAWTTAVVEKNRDGIPTATRTVEVAVVVDGDTGATRTTTVYPAKARTTLITLTDSAGRIVSIMTRVIPMVKTTMVISAIPGVVEEFTEIFDVPVAAPTDIQLPRNIPVTLTDASGVPTATVTANPLSPKGKPVPPVYSTPDGEGGFHILTNREYWMIFFLPVLAAIPCSVFAEMISSNIATLLPFRRLSRAGGATVEESLVRPMGLILGFLPRGNNPAAFLSALFVLLSAAITSLSSEAVGIGLGGNCKSDDFKGCYLGVAVFLQTTRALQALLAVSLAVVIGMAVILSRWTTGVATHPGGIMATGALIQDEHVRRLFRRLGVEKSTSGSISHGEIANALGGHRFYLDFFKHQPSGRLEYGITAEKITTPRNKAEPKWITRSITKASTIASSTMQSIRPRRIAALDWTTYRPVTITCVLDSCGLLFHFGLIILITYYNATELPHTDFEKFMNSQDFGVRIFFTALGVLLAMFWDKYYTRVAALEPYRLLSLHPQPASTLAISPPTDVFTGALHSIFTHGQIFVSIVAITNILSKFVPMLLSNIPFSPIQTWQIHLVCAWGTIASLVLMVLVIAYGMLFMKYPDMQIDPAKSLAGRVYYLCDSEVVQDFEGLSLVTGEKEKKQMMAVDEEKERKFYGFGKMKGVSGMVGRTGVNYWRVDEKGKKGGGQISGGNER
ncbi:hypothetical protein B0T16DRAFT_420926 [Cercophora newfieldiana]|uniref:Uncharacterized protein n=1 Tax=Cercophora newfieldiana TaxID=92897 RepID=A0AA39XZU4_9PEZI|nr:hypothetical protein B0T16DRAFT_420926 [Cercophora newfieldiana]